MRIIRGGLAHNPEIQIALSLFNRERLTPTTAGIMPAISVTSPERARDFRMICAETEFLAEDQAEISERAAAAPTEAEAFIRWFEDLKRTGPGQGDALFPWLAREATFDEMKWFIGQEVAGEAGFDDLVALTQLRMPTPVKLELARNYWDEMGRGTEKGMHGPMLAKLAEELALGETALASIVPEALALGNLMVGLAMSRNTAFHSLGCLGIVELTAPDRARAVYEGLKRLGVTPTGQRYYLLHSTLDVQHSVQWNKEALYPLVKSRPECARAIAEGALMRLAAGARCFARYRQELLELFETAPAAGPGLAYTHASPRLSGTN